MATTSSAATSRTPRVVAILTVGAVVAGIVAVALLRRPEPTDGGGAVAPDRRPPRPPGRSERQVRVSMIMVIYGRKTERPGTERTRAEALAIAQGALARIAAGERFERVLLDVTDDRNQQGEPYAGQPFNDGSYTIAESTPVLAAVRRVAFALRVGLVHPEPIDAGDAFLILRRDE